MRIQYVNQSNQRQNTNFCARVRKIGQPQMKKIIGDCFSLKTLMSENPSTLPRVDRLEIEKLVSKKTGEKYSCNDADILLFPTEKDLLEDEVTNSKTYASILKKIIKNAVVMPQELYNKSILKTNKDIEEWILYS